LKERINANTVAKLLQEAINSGDSKTVVRLLRENPNLLHVPLWSGNGGTPMSHAPIWESWNPYSGCKSRATTGNLIIVAGHF
jgi:hypothetical protein